MARPVTGREKVVSLGAQVLGSLMRLDGLPRDEAKGIALNFWRWGAAELGDSDSDLCSPPAIFATV